MPNPIRMLINCFKLNTQLVEKNSSITADTILANLEREDITDSTRLDTWKDRRAHERWNFSDSEVLRLNINSFISGYQQTRLCKEFKYFLMVKNINYVDCTATFVFKKCNISHTFTFHVFDFERVLIGCNKVLGHNTERTFYLQRKVLSLRRVTSS